MAIDKFTISRHGIFSKYYKIFNDKGQIYRVETGWFLKSLTFYNSDNQEVLKIRRPFSFIQIKFEIVVNDQVRASIISESALKNKLSIESLAGLYFVEGNFWGDTYEIEDAHEVIAKVAKKTFGKPRYGVAVAQGHDNLFILAIVMTIELLTRVKKARRSAG